MTSPSPEPSELTDVEETRKPHVRWLWILLSLLVLGGVGYVLSVSEDTIDVARTTTSPTLQLVSITPVSKGPQTIEVSTFAEVRPRWSAELRVAVSGRINSVSQSALAGELVEVGTALIEIENSRYVAELASVEQALKEANLALWNARNANIIAGREFKRTGRSPPNDLALKLPQLDIANSAVKTAEARILAAQRQLDETRIKAPFTGFVTERFVSPGQSVNVGDRLLKLVDSSTFELTVELGRKDWKLLKKPLKGLKAHVLDQDGHRIAEATIRRGGGFLDETTRLYKVFLEMENPAGKEVLTGDFVKVLLPGITVPSALDIPASALTQEGYVWHLNAEDRLQRSEPTVLFRRQDRVVVEAPESSDAWRIAVTPLVSFLPGQKVQPQIVRK